MHTISMSRTVDMAIVPILRLVLNMSRVNGDATSLLFRSLVYLSVVGEFGTTLAGKDLGDRCGQSSFTMIDVTCAGGQSKAVTKRPNERTNGANVHMRFRPRKFGSIRVSPGLHFPRHLSFLSA